MKIIILGPFPPFRGGISDFNLALANNLLKEHIVENVNFTTQYPKWLFPGKTQYKSYTDRLDVPSIRVLSSINPTPWKKTANYINEQEPDLVIFRYWLPFFALAMGKVAKYLKKNSQTKLLAVCDNIVPHEKHFFDKTLTSYFLKKIDHFIVMSRMGEKDLHRFIENASYSYSPHPIYNIFGPAFDKAEARKKLDISAQKVILFFGIIRPYKGLDILLKSIPILVEKLSDFKVLVVGESYEPFDKYQKLIDNLNIVEYLSLKLEFLTNSDIALYFSAADVVALPYKSATQSGIAQIAYHYDKPVVTSNVGGLPEIVEDGKVGFVVKPEPEALASRLAQVFEDDRHLEFAENVKAYKERFSWKTFINTVEKLIEE
jgi:glycosyltransferase involved in cell wall biosynthesis